MAQTPLTAVILILTASCPKEGFAFSKQENPWLDAGSLFGVYSGGDVRSVHSFVRAKAKKNTSVGGETR